MGVPVIAKKGNFLSHLGESIAHNTGHPDWIASDNSDYIFEKQLGSPLISTHLQICGYILEAP